MAILRACACWHFSSPHVHTPPSLSLIMFTLHTGFRSGNRCCSRNRSRNSVSIRGIGIMTTSSETFPPTSVASWVSGCKKETRINGQYRSIPSSIFTVSVAQPLLGHYFFRTYKFLGWPIVPTANCGTLQSRIFTTVIFCSYWAVVIISFICTTFTYISKLHISLWNAAMSQHGLQQLHSLRRRSELGVTYTFTELQLSPLAPKPPTQRNYAISGDAMS